MFNKIVTTVLPYLPQRLVWIFSRRYIAGRTVEDCIRVSRQLNDSGAEVTVDLLGEFIKNLTEAEANRNEYLHIIDRFTAEGIRGNFSLKPTSFGLLIDKETCYQHIRAIVRKASEKKGFVRIDMEDSQCVDLEIELYRRLKAEFPGNVGLVLQAYLRRTVADIESMMDIHSEDSPLNFRLCKGIYREPPEIAYIDYQEVRDNFLLILETMLKNGMYAGIATHDRYLIEEAYKLIEHYRQNNRAYEFQMLYGVTPELRAGIIANGHRMRIYVPFGKEWFNYSTRRLKENPKIATHIIKALFVRG